MRKLIFDVGASVIKFAIMDNEGNMFKKGSEVTPHDTFEHFIEVIQRIYETCEDDIDGIGFSLPRTIDASKGMIYAPGGLLYNENVNIVEAMHQFTSLPIAIENDGKSAALAEVGKGNLHDCDDGIVIVLGSGIGGGIIKDRRLWKGSHLFAGEFSYMMMNENASSFENVWALQGSTTALIMNVAKRKKIAIEELNGYKIFKMIDKGDKDALIALEEMTQSLARGIFNFAVYS